MNIKIGTDIIEVERIRNAMENAEFSTRVFTPEEIKYCESGADKIKYQRYAARFAAKEAVFKAISPILANKFDIEWKDIEVVKDEQERPNIEIHNEKVKNVVIDISISHVETYAIATAVAYIEGE